MPRRMPRRRGAFARPSGRPGSWCGSIRASCGVEMRGTGRSASKSTTARSSSPSSRRRRKDACKVTSGASGNSPSITPMTCPSAWRFWCRWSLTTRATWKRTYRRPFGRSSGRDCLRGRRPQASWLASRSSSLRVSPKHRHKSERQPDMLPLLAHPPRVRWHHEHRNSYRC